MTPKATAALQRLNDQELARVGLIAAALPATITLPLLLDWEKRQWVVAEVLAAAAAIDEASADGAFFEPVRPPDTPHLIEQQPECRHEMYGESGPCIHCGLNFCAVCGLAINDGDLFMEVRRRDEVDADTRLLAHVGDCQ